MKVKLRNLIITKVDGRLKSDPILQYWSDADQKWCEIHEFECPEEDRETADHDPDAFYEY